MFLAALPWVLAAIAVIIALEDAWRDSRQLRIAYTCIAALAAVAFLKPIDYGAADRWSRAFVAARQAEVRALIEGIKIRKTVDPAERRKAERDDFSRLAPAEKGPPQFTSVYPRGGFFPDYASAVNRFPAIARGYDLLETGQWAEARISLSDTLAVINRSSGDHSRLRAYVEHLRAIALLESGKAGDAIIVLERVKRSLEAQNEPAAAQRRAAIDLGLARLASGQSALGLPAGFQTALRANTRDNLQEMTLYLFARAHESRASGANQAADLLMTEAKVSAAQLRAQDEIAWTRLRALLGQTFGVLRAEPAAQSLAMAKRLKPTAPPAAIAVKDAAENRPAMASPVEGVDRQAAMAVPGGPNYTALYSPKRFFSGHPEAASYFEGTGEIIAALEAGKWGQANGAARQFLKTELALPDGMRALILHLRAQAMLEDGQLTMALATLKEALKLTPPSSITRLARARLFIDIASAEYALGRYPEALDPNLLTALLAEKDANAHELALHYRNKALVNFRLGQPISAKLWFDEATAYAHRLEASDRAAADRVALLLRHTAPLIGENVSAVAPGAEKKPAVTIPTAPIKSAPPPMATGVLLNTSPTGIMRYTFIHDRKRFLDAATWSSAERSELELIFNALERTNWPYARRKALAMGRRIYHPSRPLAG